MSNRLRLRPGGRAAQDQALASARDMATEYGAVIATYLLDSTAPCVFAEEPGYECPNAARHGVRLYVHGVSKPPLEYRACDAHVLATTQLLLETARGAGVATDGWDMAVDRRLYGATTP